MPIQIYFTDFFGVSSETLESYGAFDTSLINDLPVFIDPFLLFNSPKPEYQKLHNGIIEYVKFLKSKSLVEGIDDGLMEAWFLFPEVRQNWLGFSKEGNGGSGLGWDFARALHKNLRTVFTNFGAEEISRGSHLEKLCLIKEGIGRDNISDFTTNLIKEYLLEYSENFAKAHLAENQRKVVKIEKVTFNYETETWISKDFELPFCNGDYVILTPKDILTRDDTWISRKDLVSRLEKVVMSVPDGQLRSQVNNYLLIALVKDDTAKGKHDAAVKVVEEFPQILDWYIKHQEESGTKAKTESKEKVKAVEELFIEEVRVLVDRLSANSPFYKIAGNTYEEAHERLAYFKDVIENKDGYRIFYPKGQPITSENQVQLLYRLTWRGTPFDVNREVNNGRGPVDYAISMGKADKTLVEFKLASNSQLKRNLENQVAIYEKASDAKRSIKVIVFFTVAEQAKVTNILKELKLDLSRDVVLIDACISNKPSASKA